jgi:hypothetical protein
MKVIYYDEKFILKFTSPRSNARRIELLKARFEQNNFVYTCLPSAMFPSCQEFNVIVKFGDFPIIDEIVGSS